MAYDNRTLRGVGGWLAFFVVVMAVLQPLGIVVQTMGKLMNPAVGTLYGPSWPLLLLIEASLNTAVVLAGWYVAWRLNRIYTWRTVRITIAIIWLTGVGALLLNMLAVVALPQASGPILIALGVQLLRSVMYSGIWTAYFLRSKRVANTYGRVAPSEELGQVFS